MEVGLVQKINIDDEMQQAYLDYAMSVIVSRALPDARDGLKPVHRRILYAMYDMGIRPESPFKKSARIVGEVLGKYHPHGDMAVYDAMARMAQDFSLRCLLIDGQGNFGSVDGDPPAAMRYTEARLAAPAMQMLADIAKNTVEFDPNFDETLSEPRVLPAAIPNLLVNGATGIAVGMSTSIPPHNLGEVVDALRHMLENWEKLDDINLEDIMRFIQGPDFPTGGVIIQESGEEALMSAYGTGRGGVTLQARAHLEEMERGRNRIIVTELPYMTNKASLIERIADLVREERLVGIADLRDESDRQGMRIVIELTKAADPEALLQDLYKHTPMQSTFSIIMLALVDGEPRLLSLKQALRVYLDHRLEIVRRRSEYDLEKAKQRAHILEGLRVALQHLDEVIDLIRKAPDVETARVRLMKRFKLSELQAQAILDMQLRRLAALERKKIELEHKEVQDLIKELSGLLRSHKKMRQIVADELLAMKEAFGDRRRTHIVQLKDGKQKKSLLTVTDLAPDKSVWLAVMPDGLISRTHEDVMPRQSGAQAPAWLLRANTRDTLYLVNTQGDTAALPVHAVPEAENVKDGVPFSKVSALKAEDQLAALFTLPPKGQRAAEGFVLTCTRQGYVKKSLLSELPGPSANTFPVVRVNEGDRLGWLRVTNGQSELLLMTSAGMAIRFSEEEVRPMGLVAAGVMGVKLQKDDEVVGISILPQPGELFMLATDGSAKRVALDQFPKQGRYGQGVVAWKLPPKIKVAGITIGKGTARVTVFLARLAPKIIRLDAAPLQARAARGKPLQELKSGDQVLGLSAAWEMQGGAAGMADEVTQLAFGKKASRDGAGGSSAGTRAKSARTSSQAEKPRAGAKSKSTKPASKAAPGGKSSTKSIRSKAEALKQPARKTVTTKSKAKTAGSPRLKTTIATQLELVPVKLPKKVSAPKTSSTARKAGSGAKGAAPTRSATKKAAGGQTMAKSAPASKRTTPSKPAKPAASTSRQPAPAKTPAKKGPAGKTTSKAAPVKAPRKGSAAPRKKTK